MGITTIYSTVEDSGMFELLEHDIDKVKCPLENPETFERGDQSLNIAKNRIPMIEMSSTTNDESMTTSDAISFLSMFSSLLKLHENDEQHATKSNYKSVTSPLIQKFAVNSRVHSGERLVKRSIRHAMDKAAPSVIDGDISVGRHNDEMVIIFENKVKPSMIKGLHKK